MHKQISSQNKWEYTHEFTEEFTTNFILFFNYFKLFLKVDCYFYMFLIHFTFYQILISIKLHNYLLLLFYIFSVGSTDNRDQDMNALRTVPGHNHVINVHELTDIVTGLKNNKAVGNGGIPSEVYKFASERLLTCQYYFPVVCLLESYRVPLCT